MAAAGEVKRRGIAGSPASYIALLAAVTAVLQMIPFSVVLGPGVSFPLSLAISGLIGVLLGPTAGTLSVAIGSGLGVMIAPHTAFMGPLTILVLAASALAGGLMAHGKKLWVVAYLIAASLLWWAIYLVMSGFPKNWVVMLQPWRYLVAAAMLLIPGLTEKAVAMLRSPNKLPLAVALGFFIWISSQVDHTLSSIIGNELIFQIPEEVWNVLIVGVIGAERGALTLVGMVIGTGVITGLRQMGVRRPEKSVW